MAVSSAKSRLLGLLIAAAAHALPGLGRAGGWLAKGSWEA